MTGTLPQPDAGTTPTRERGTPITDEPRVHLGAVVTGVIFVIAGIAWLLDVLDILDVRWSMLAPVGLVVVGAALVFGSRRAHVGGLVALGIVLLVAAFVGSMAGPWTNGFDGPSGDVREHPMTLGQIDSEYSIGAGSMRVDLTDVEPDEYVGVQEVEANVSMGEMRIIVPDGVEVRLIANVGMGEARLFDEEASGFGTSRELETPDYDDADAQLEVRGNVGMGSLRIERS